MATVVVGCFWALPSAFADCIVTTNKNPVTGHEERVTAESDGHDLEIKWSERIGDSWVNDLVLSDNAEDHSCPQIAFDATGATAAWHELTSAGLARVVIANGADGLEQ